MCSYWDNFQYITWFFKKNYTFAFQAVLAPLLALYNFLFKTMSLIDAVCFITFYYLIYKIRNTRFPLFEMPFILFSFGKLLLLWF